MASLESPTRILIKVRRRCPGWDQAWKEPQKTITQVLRSLNYDKLITPDDVYNSPACRFMAVERWDSHTFIVVDLFNHDYDYSEAHLPGKNILPVRIVSISQGVDGLRFKAQEPRAIPAIDEELRVAHDHHGWKVEPPYKIDHANGTHPVYWKPRSAVHK